MNSDQMKILIVSDTHRRTENFFSLLKKIGKVDCILHCGDSEGTADTLKAMAECPAHIVSGNCDLLSGLPKELVLTFGNYKVWVTHGNRYAVSVSPNMIRSEAKERGMDVVMYGHTHCPELIHEDGLVSLNPGSLSQPRQAGGKPSYAIMELDREGKAHFTISYIS